jgi:hypothetical protein
MAAADVAEAATVDEWVYENESVAPQSEVR